MKNAALGNRNRVTLSAWIAAQTQCSMTNIFGEFAFDGDSAKNSDVGTLPGSVERWSVLAWASLTLLWG
jgi:hypothetical protein